MRLEMAATVQAVRGDLVKFDQTCFYPGGGGQPSDTGTAILEDGRVMPILEAFSEDRVVWHRVEGGELLPGQVVRLQVDAARRSALSRYHTVLHILNTIAMRDHNAWITGAQIAEDYARIDFKWEGFSSLICGELERQVNTVIAGNHPISDQLITAEEFAQRPDLRRTLDVQPPVIDGMVRIVAIEGFDEQACGGTHVPTTAELGRFSIYKTENKGRINKRIYVRLGPDHIS